MNGTSKVLLIAIVTVSVAFLGLIIILLSSTVHGQSAVLDSTTGTVYGLTNNSLVAIDKSTGLIKHNFSDIFHSEDNAHSLGQDTTRNILYVGFDGYILAINATSNVLISNVTVQLDPNYLEVDHKYGLVFINMKEGYPNLASVNFSNNEVKYAFAGKDPTEMAVDPLNNLLYMIGKEGDNSYLYKIDGSSLELSKKISISSEPSDLIIDTNRKLIYVSNRDNSRISVIDSVKNVVTDNIIVGPLAEDSRPVILFDNKDKLIFLANSENRVISLINASSGALKSISGIDPFSEIFLDSQNGNILTYDPYTVKIQKIRPNWTDNVGSFVGQNIFNKDLFSIDVNRGSTDVEYSESNNKIYVSNPIFNSIYVINATSNKIEDTIGLKNGPLKIDVDPNRDVLLVTNNENTISYIDQDSKTEIDILVVPSTIVNFDFDMNRIFVASKISNGTLLHEIDNNKNVSKSYLKLNNTRDLKINNLLGKIYALGDELISIEPYDRNITQIKLNTTNGIKTMRLGDSDLPGSFDINYLTNTIYSVRIRDTSNSFLYVINGYNDQVEKQVEFEGRYDNVFVNQWQNIIFTTGIEFDVRTGEDVGVISVFDGFSSERIKKITLDAKPIKIVSNNRINMTYILDDSGRIHLLDLRNYEIVDPVISIKYEASPPYSGSIYCNGENVNNRIIEYGYKTLISCEAKPEMNFKFGSWTGPSSNNLEVEFTSDKNQRITANFSEIWPTSDQLIQILGIVISVIITSITTAVSILLYQKRHKNSI